MKQIKDDYFLDVDDKMLEYLELESSKCVESINQSIFSNKENSYKLLSLLIVGVGASFLLITQSNKVDFFTMLLLIFCTGWTICLVLLAVFCLKPKKKPILGNSPLDLYSEYYKTLEDCNKLSILRRYKLSTTEDIINILTEEDDRVGRWLDRVIILSVITPITSIIFSFLVHYLQILAQA